MPERWGLALKARVLALLGVIALVLVAVSGLGRDASPPQASGLGAMAANENEPERASDGVPIKAHDPKTPALEGPQHPHPITPAHERIYRENNLVGALNLAVDLEDPLRIRELVAEYRAEYPEDEHRLQDGYAIIADCLDRPGPDTLARAQDFWNHQIRSQTRRYVRRHCLERLR